MTPQEQNIKIVEGQLKAYNGRNLDEFCRHFDLNVVVKNLATNETILTGLPKFKETYRKVFDESPQLRAEIKKRIAVADFVIDEECVTGRNGSSGVMHVAAIYEVKNGVIRSVWFAR